MLIGQCQTLTETNHINLNTKASYIRKLTVADGSSADAAAVHPKINNIRDVVKERSSSQKNRFLSWLGLLKLPDLSEKDDGSSFSPPELIAILPSTGSDVETNATQKDSITEADSSSSSSSSSLISGYNRTSSNSSSVSNGESSSVTGSQGQSSSSSSAAQVQSSASTGYYVSFHDEEDSSLPQGDSTSSTSSSEENEASSDDVNSKSSSSLKNSSQLLQAKRKESSSTIFLFAVLIAILSVGFLGAVANHDTRERLLRTTGIVNGRWQRKGKSVRDFIYQHFPTDTDKVHTTKSNIFHHNISFVCECFFHYLHSSG